MKTIQDVLQLSTQYLRGQRRPAEELLAFTLGMKRMELYMHFDKPVEEKELTSLREPLKRLLKGEPIEYVLGVVDFGGCQIGVDRRVLIPRQETEILFELILKRLRGQVVWDVCTGSGCLGIALKKRRPELGVTLSDISIETARENVERNQAAVACLEGDLLEPFEGMADAVVCNPPYVSASEYSNLEPSVRDFEPKLALVGGERGTEFYERLAHDLPRYVRPGGQVFLEIGSGQAESLRKIFSHYRVEVEKDWAGHDRFFFLEM